MAILLLLSVIMAIFFTIYYLGSNDVRIGSLNFGNGTCPPDSVTFSDSNAETLKSFPSEDMINCPVDALAWVLIFSKTPNTNTWNAVQDFFGVCGYYCDSNQYCSGLNNSFATENSFSKQTTGTYCNTTITEDALNYPFTTKVGTVETSYQKSGSTIYSPKAGAVSTTPFRLTLMKLFQEYSLPAVVFLWIAVFFEIVVMIASACLQRAESNAKGPGRQSAYHR